MKALIKISLMISAMLMLIISTGCTNESTDTPPVSTPEYRQITMSEAQELMAAEDGYIILDVRRAEEYAAGHIPGAINIPNESIGTAQIPSLPDKSQLILVYCRSGVRSLEAAKKLIALGYSNIVDIGGILDWTGEIETSKVPEPAPDFTVYSADKSTVKLSDFSGKPIVINFWATWCPPCKEELPAFNTLYEKYKDKVIFLMINVDGTGQNVISTVQGFLDEGSYTFPVYYDLSYDASAKYEVSAIPETFFINADGILSTSHLGAMSENTLEGYIKTLLEK